MHRGCFAKVQLLCALDTPPGGVRYNRVKSNNDESSAATLENTVVLDKLGC